MGKGRSLPARSSAGWAAHPARRTCRDRPLSSDALFDAFVTLWRGTSPVEWLAAALGIAYVVLLIGQHRAGWIAGGVSTAVYLYVFGVAGLYMQAVLQGYYVLVSVYGWWAWRGGVAGPTLSVSRAGWRVQLLGVAAVVLASVASATWLARETHSSDPYLDSLTTWGSVFATWLATRKKLDNWTWWFVVDSLIVVLCWKQKLYAAMIPYVLYLGLVVVGWRSWSVDMKIAGAAAADGAKA